MVNQFQVTVLLGGRGAEREVSLRSGAAVARALRGLGHAVSEVDPAGESWELPTKTEVVFLMPLSTRLAPVLRKASFVFLVITEHPHSFESCACAVLGKPGGVGSGDSLAGLLHWTGISVTGSRSAGNIITSAGPDDNFGRQFWQQFSLMKIKWTIIFKNGTCIGDCFRK